MSDEFDLDFCDIMEAEMHLHESTFNYLKPTDRQMETMAQARAASKLYAETLDRILPDGADKTHLIRVIRTVAMWACTCITRQADGTPRTMQDP